MPIPTLVSPNRAALRLLIRISLSANIYLIDKSMEVECEKLPLSHYRLVTMPI